MMRTDVAVVGGGISGLYSALRLKQAQPHKKVTVFEALPHVGGRIQTGTFLGGIFSLGYGANVIEPDYQTHMHRFVQELGIPLMRMEEKDAPPLGKLHLDRLTAEERQYLIEHSDLSPDVALLDFGLKKILGKQWDLDKDQPTNPGRDKQLKKLKLEATYDGRPLYEQGIWTVFASALSHEAVEFCREKGSYYNMKNDNQNAADWIVLLLNKRLVGQPPYIPVGGMIGLIKATADKCSKLGIAIHLNHRLTSLHPEDKDRVRLKFDPESKESLATDWIADQVILAMPQAPLKKLAASFPKQVNALLESVIPINLLLVSAALKNPPWDSSVSSDNAENVPVRSAHFAHKMHENNPYGMAIFWCDGPWQQYWRSFVEDKPGDYEGYQAAPQLNQNPRLKREIEKQLQRIFVTKEPPAVAEWGIRDWGRQPFGAGVHFWKPGAQSYVVIQQLKAFSLSEHSSVKNVHICGEAFSERQGYCEGAIRTADRVVKAILLTYGVHFSAYRGALFGARVPTTGPIGKLAPHLPASELITMGFSTDMRRESELARKAAETSYNHLRWNDPRVQRQHDQQFGLIVHPGRGPR